MQLKPGQVAVPFTVQTAHGETVSLAQFAGKPVLLMFFRYASCPMCNLRLHDFAQVYARLQARGLVALAFFHSSAPSICAHAGGRHYPFPLVADPACHVYRLYGVETSWPRFLLSLAKPGFYVDWFRSLRHRFWGGVAWQMAKMPADFLIGRDGRIVMAQYGRDIGDHLPIARIEAFLDELDRPTTLPEGVRVNQHGRVPHLGGFEADSGGSRRTLSAVVGLSLLWALALVGSSFFLKGVALGEWLDSLLYLSAGVWLSTYLLRRPASRCA